MPLSSQISQTLSVIFWKSSTVQIRAGQKSSNSLVTRSFTARLTRLIYNSAHLQLELANSFNKRAEFELAPTRSFITRVT